MSVAPLVGVLEKHGKHYAVRSFFEPGTASSRQAQGGERVGDLVIVVPGAAAGRGWSAGSAARTSRATCSRR